MLNIKILTPLIKLHRWLALLLTPVFLLIIISGAILAFKPILQEGASQRTTFDVPALVAALDKVDPKGKASLLTVARDGNSFSLRSADAGVAGTFDIHGAAMLKKPGFDIFDFSLRLHKSLLINAGLLVEIATYVMLFLIISGLLLGWPRLRNTVSGWHSAIGWLGLPLVILTPLTALLMVLHIGSSRLPAYEAAKTALPIARTLEIAARQTDLTQLTQARPFRRGAVMLSAGATRYIVSGSGQLVPITQGPSLVHLLHEGTWAGAWSGLVNLLAACSLMGLLLTGVWTWWRRRRQSAIDTSAALAPASSTLVAYASQTGTAAKLAQATMQALQAAGEPVRLASLAALRPEELAGFRRTLLIASTTGEGQLPEPARAFMHTLTGAGDNSTLQGCRFSLLALGDRHYASFCGGALQLRTALLEQGAEEFMPAELVDGEAGGSWQAWLTRLSPLLGMKQPVTAPLPVLETSVRLQLVERIRLDDPQQSELKQAWQLRFRAHEQALQFRPGDLLLIRPTAEATARCYSIGSSSQTGTESIDLTVSLHSEVGADGTTRFGLASGYLCQQLSVGAEIEAQLRPHPDFNPPGDNSRPLILIATGCGIAPFPGFLAERRRRGYAGPVWLFFGNRKRTGDFYHHAFIEDCLADGTLARLNTAFSRDAADGHYIEQQIEEQAVELLRWINERDAHVYVCGNARTLGVGLEATLLKILAAHPDGSGESAAATLARWKAEGILKMDLFA